MGKKIIPLILAGGKGCRFWPLSREHYPKQFLSLDGEMSLLEKTFLRAQGMAPEGIPWLVGSKDQYPLVADCLKSYDGGYRFIGEPRGKNTAAAIYLACRHMGVENGDSVVVIMPADHFIGDQEAFLHRIHAAASWSLRKKAMVTIGVTPRYPATGFGYIEKGHREGEKRDHCYRALSFTEKPGRERAKKYLKHGKFLWHSGIVVAPLSVLFSAYRRYMPELVSVLDAVSLGDEEALEKAYEMLEPTSFDNGILEKERYLYVLSAHFPWDDVGSFERLSSVLSEDRHGNICRENVFTANTERTVILTDNRLTVAFGVKDLVVVEDHGVLLICPRDQTEKIRDVVEALPREYR